MGVGWWGWEWGWQHPGLVGGPARPSPSAASPPHTPPPPPPQPHLDPHVVNGHPRHNGHVRVADAHQEAVHPLVPPAHQRACKHDAPLRVHRRVGDPILLGQRGGGVHVPRARGVAVGGGRRHFDRVVAVAQLGEPKAAGHVQRVHRGLHLPHMLLRAQLEHGAGEQVEVDGGLGGHRAVGKAADVVDGENVERVGAGVAEGGAGRFLFSGGWVWARPSPTPFQKEGGGAGGVCARAPPFLLVSSPPLSLTESPAC